MANAPEKKSYEEQWREVFNQAEMPPSSNVWKSIDQELTTQESGKYRKGFFFYRAVAAGLLLCIAGLSWYILTRPADSDQIVQGDVSSTEQQITPSDEANRESNLASSSSMGSATQTENGTETEYPLADNTDQSSGDDKTTSTADNVALGTSEEGNLTAGDGTESSAKNATQLAVNDAKEPALAAKTLIFPNEEVSQREEELLSDNHRVGRVAALPPDALAMNAPTWADNVDKLFLVPQYRKREVADKEKSGAQFFAGLAMAPSLFDPNFQSQNEAALASADVPVAESFSYALAADGVSNARNFSSNTVMVAEGLENQSSVSLSYGFDVGLTLGEHWSIESGLDYQNFQTVTQTQYSVVDLQSGERYPLLATNAVANQANAFNVASTGSNSEVDNQFQFVSVPLRVGYNVHFSKITLSVSPGIAANLFLGNRISSQDFASTTLISDGGSPFNSQYISGLLSGGVYYQLLENYSLSFSPSYQFALSEFARTSAAFSSLPQSLGLIFGFRYNFQ
ncbi:MAG: hypothetical protein ACFB15_05670 [Cyclobacteriaceae bacterium]